MEGLVGVVGGARARAAATFPSLRPERGLANFWRERRVVVGWVLASVLAIADAATTYVALRGGHGVEVNPVLSRLMERFGTGAVLVLRATLFGPLATGLLALLALGRLVLVRRLAGGLLGAAVLLWGVAVLNNVVALTR